MNKLIIITLAFLLVIPLALADYTSLLLEAPTSEILDDTYGRSDATSNDRSAETILGIQRLTARRERGIIKFDLTGIPSYTIKILDAKAHFYVYNNEGQWAENIYHVLEHDWDESVTWDDGFVCGTTEDTVNGSCNSTYADQVNATTGWFTFNVTSAVKNEIDEGDNNVSLLFMANDENAGGASTGHNRYSSNYNADATLRPFLNISYTYAYPLSACDPETSTTSTINFTFYDEDTNARIEADVDATFDYTYEGTAYTYTVDEDDVYNFSVCIYPTNLTLEDVDYNIYYENTNYPQRRYYSNDQTLDNVTIERSLYLLNSADGIYIRFRVTDNYNNPLSDVEVKMETTIAGTTEIVEQEETDDSGLATFWADPDTDYSFTFTITGYEIYTLNLRPTTSEIYTVNLEAEEAGQNYSYATGIDYFFLPDDLTLNNNTNYSFRFNLTSSYWNITNCNLTLKNTTTTFTTSDQTFTTSGCTINITYNTGNLSEIIAEAVYEINNNVVETVSVQYAVINTYKGDFSLKNFLDDLEAFGEAGFNDFTRMIIAFIVCFAIVGFVAYKFESLREPEPLILLTWILILMFSYVGWLTVNLNTIPEVRGLPAGWLKDYIIWVLLTLGGGAYIIRKHL